MKKLIKRIRLKLGLFTRKEMFVFGIEMMNKYVQDKNHLVMHSDIENFIHDLKNN